MPSCEITYVITVTVDDDRDAGSEVSVHGDTEDGDRSHRALHHAAAVLAAMAAQECPDGYEVALDSIRDEALQCRPKYR